VKARIAATLAVVLALVSLAVFAEAGQKNRIIEVSGVLEERVVTVSVPTELALLVAAPGQGTAASAAARSNMPVGTVDEVKVERGVLVKRGDVLLTIAGRLAGANLDKAQAQYEYIVATIDNLEGTHTDLAESRSELSETEAGLKAKRAEAQRAFDVKSAEGRAKADELERKLVSVKAGLAQAQAGLLAAEEAENEARKLIDAAEKLADDDPAKAKRLEQAGAMLQGALGQQEVLQSKVMQLAEAKAQLEKGISAIERGLASGKQQSTQGAQKIEGALAKISEGRRKISEGSSKVIRTIRILKKRRDQAEVGLSLARKISEASDIKAPGSGRVRELKASDGMVVYPGQRLMLIAREDTLRLYVYLPVDEAARVRAGSDVRVYVDGAPGRAFKAKVTGIGGKAVFAPSNLSSGELELIRVVRIQIEVENEDGVLKAGMPADARITVDG